MFEKDIDEVIGRGHFDEDDFKNIKDLTKHTDEIPDKYEGVFT